jgi:hypothetical protein
MNDKQGRVWKEVVVTCMKVLPWHSLIQRKTVRNFRIANSLAKSQITFLLLLLHQLKIYNRILLFIGSGRAINNIMVGCCQSQ